MIRVGIIGATGSVGEALIRVLLGHPQVTLAFLGSDHAGLELNEHLLNWLADHGYEAVDHGPFVYDAQDDYPGFCLRAAEAVAGEQGSLGVVIGGSGNGEQIAANKVKGVRAALVWKAGKASRMRFGVDRPATGPWTARPEDGVIGVAAEP